MNKILLLSSTEGKHTGRSGYSVITNYLSGAYCLEVIRKIPDNIPDRIIDAILSRLALSRWYKKSSLVLEWKAFKYIRKNNTELVHLLWGDRDIGFLDRFSAKGKFKICCSIHNCAGMLDGIFNFPGRLNNIDAFILMSETQKDFFVKAGVQPEKLHVILHGIDTGYFKPAVFEANAKESFQVLSVGSWQRDFELLREVCLEFEKDHSVKFKIVSNEKFRHHFLDLENVEFHSGLSNEELLQAYHDADCFLMTARDTSANNAILEAMACGLPIVAENVGGVKEYVNPGCAILCEAKNAGSIGEAILKIAHSAELQKQMAIQARAKALELDWKNISKKVGELYISLTN